MSRILTPEQQVEVRSMIEQCSKHITMLEEGANKIEKTLAQLDYDNSQDARARINEARRELRWAASGMEQAAKQYE